MKSGDLVIVLGRQDSRIRDKSTSELVIGTFDGVLCDDQVYILLPNGEIWIGQRREVRIYEKENKKEVSKEAEEKDSQEENQIDIGTII